MEYLSAVLPTNGGTPRDKDAALRVRDAELAERDRVIEELRRRLDLLQSDRE